MMKWQIESSINEAAWFEDYVRNVIAHESPQLPEHDFRIGSTEVHWHQVAPGVAHVAALGASDLDELFAVHMTSIELANHGYRRAHMQMDYDHSVKLATWDDVYDDARKIVQSGGVQMLRNGQNTIAASVASQTTPGQRYDVEIKRDDPNSQSITSSHCTCDWGQFQNTPRTRQWKRFQDRPCKHILATYWTGLAMPPDDSPQQGIPGMAPGGMPGKQSPGMGAPRLAPAAPSGQISPGQMQMDMGGGPQGAPGAAGAPPMGPQAPAPEDTLPQFPMDPSMQPQHNPISMPGGKAQTPLNPNQFPQGPGGTFSSWDFDTIHHVFSADQPYQNGDRVQLMNEDIGTLVGRSEEHGAGQPFTIPKGQVGEVLGTHPSTGMVNVLYMGKPFENNGPLQPYGATAWHWPSDIKLRNDIRAPGPALRRTR